MKRWIALICLILLCMPLAACHSEEDSAFFFYLRRGEDYAYGASDAVVAPETRDCSGRKNNLHYMLTLYLEGPVDTALLSPFPEGTQILSLQRSGSSLSIELSEEFTNLAGMDQTLASTCIAYTCFDLCSAHQVHIYAQSAQNETISITLTREDLVLLDDGSYLTPEE